MATYLPITFLDQAMSNCAATSEMHDDRDEEQDQEDNEQQLGDASSRDGYPCESQNARDDSHNQEDQCPVKHELPPSELAVQRNDRQGKPGRPIQLKL